ncbi:MAG: hypothetical protein JWQ70_239 [Aeromicrobium sp.]|nr:hypothetical protein [Aeromicrobium sp.]
MSIATEARRIPPLGGFSPRFYVLELRRMLRNKRSMIFTLVMPSAFFLLFGGDASYRTDRSGHGNVTAYIMVSMAVYGAMIATTAGGAMVANERALGWSRQLRLTPLKPVAYVAIKVLVAMTMGAVAIVAVFVVGNLRGADLPFGRLLACGLIGWGCTLVFAAFGLFMGYLLPSENVMQLLGPSLAILALAGGLFTPLDNFSHGFQEFAKFTPAYGVGILSRSPFGSDGNVGLAAVNIAVWTAIFVGGAAWRMSKDTQRV